MAPPSRPLGGRAVGGIELPDAIFNKPPPYIPDGHLLSPEERMARQILIALEEVRVEER